MAGIQLFMMWFGMVTLAWDFNYRRARQHAELMARLDEIRGAVLWLGSREDDCGE